MISRIALTFCCLISLAAAPSETKPAIDESFDGELSKNWTKNFGVWKVEDGSLHLSQLASDGHVAAFRYRHPLTDGKLVVEYRPEGAKVFHVGFDPFPGELKKKGHLFSVILTPTQMQLKLHKDKADANSKDQVLARAGMPALAPGQTYRLELILDGPTARATLTRSEGDQIATVEARYDSFRVKKPGLVFRVGGADGKELLLERVQFWPKAESN